MQPVARQLLGLGHVLALLGSQVSLPLTTPSPHIVGQSLSVLALAPLGQQPSPGLGDVSSWVSHLDVQVAGSPVKTAAMQPELRQPLAVAHSVELFGSQVSLPVTAPSPHFVMQSVSLPALAPGGQQPSPEVGAVTGMRLHSALH
jgi:hypothetical protein